tara:strand:- start:675 stop:1547 length:873 start_codon:yes stop_codon:yes gene_type:complete
MDELPPRSKKGTEKIFSGARKGRNHPSNLREYVHKENWPTPTPSDLFIGNLNSNQTKDESMHSMNLPKMAKNWTTPLADDTGMRKKKFAQGGTALSLQALEEEKSWPTPTATDCSNRYQTENWKGDDLSSTSHEWTKTVQEEQERWPTPTVAEADKIGNRPNYGQKGLSNHPALVGKVERKKMNKSKAKDGKSTNPDKEQERWPTPLQRDYKGMGTREKPPELYLSIPQDPKKQIDGHTCSVSCRRLNPHFAEWLMGLCLGWTSVSEPLETESFQAWQQSLSELLQKISD